MSLKMDVMNTAEFQTHLTSIMETLAKTAVVEISKLFEQNASVLRLEITRFSSENESLKKKCHFLENELQSARKSAGKMNGTEPPSSHSGLTDTGHRPAIDNVFGKEWCMNLWRHEESNASEQEDTHLDSPVIIGEPVNLLEEEPDMIMIKEEAFEDCSSEINEDDQDNISVKGAVQEEIKKILPELDSNKLQNVVNHLLIMVGVEKIEDLSLVEVSDLQDFLEPIQSRKLVKSFRQRGVVSAASSSSTACTFYQRSFKKIKSEPDHDLSLGSATQTSCPQTVISTSDETSKLVTSTVSPASNPSSQCSSVMSPFDLKVPETANTSSSRRRVQWSSHQAVIVPDVCLNPVSMKKEKILYIQSAGKDGRPRPERFAVLLFKSLVPHDVYREWSGTVNYDGSRGKNALPNNLRKAIAEIVRRKFPNPAPRDWKMIKDRLNELLRTRRLNFPLF